MLELNVNCFGQLGHSEQMDAGGAFDSGDVYLYYHVLRDYYHVYDLAFYPLWSKNVVLRR